MLNLLSKKIYVVDDDELVLKSIKRKLANYGFTDITTFDNGYDCVEHLNNKPFLILLDYQMENFNGHDVPRKIKRYNPNIHEIMLSSQRDVANAVKILKHGAFDYITKGKSDLN